MMTWWHPVCPVPANIVLWMLARGGKTSELCPGHSSSVILASQNCKFDLDREENVSVKFPNSAKTTRNLNLLLFKEVNKFTECVEFVHVTHCQYPSLWDLGLWGKRSFNCPLWVCLNILVVWRYNARVLEPSQVVYCETDRMCIIMAPFEYFWFKYVLIVCWIDNESSLKY